MSRTGTGPAEGTTTVVKIGGELCLDTGEDILGQFCREIGELRGLVGERGGGVVVVHGGGPQITRACREQGIEPAFVDGVRVTSAAEMEIVDGVLGGVVNSGLVRSFARAGVSAVGVTGASGGLLVGTPSSGGSGGAGGGYTAGECVCNPQILQHLLPEYVPVVAPVGSDAGNGAININADRGALAIALALQSDRLLFLSNVDGVLGDDGKRIAQLSEQESEKLIVANVIKDGMVEKLRNSFLGIRSGIKRIGIGQYGQYGDLYKLLDQQAGTTIQ